MYNKTILSLGFCDIRKNQGRGKCIQPSQKAEADDTDLDLIPDITKTSSNNCLLLRVASQGHEKHCQN